MAVRYWALGLHQVVPMASAAEITRGAKSNLAIALKILPRDRRDDMVVFYAFCRTIDDVADEVGVQVVEKKRVLDEWSTGLRDGFGEANQLGNELMEVAQRRGIPVDWLLEIVEGCRMDLEVMRFGSWEDLQKYNWKVAGVVGLACTRIFGCVHEDSDKYAAVLGDALQLVNVLRDVGEDLSNGVRIYLPENDMIRFQYSERDLVGRVYDGRFVAMMGYQAERAEMLFREAKSLVREVDRVALRPAAMMAEVYSELLKTMKSGRFQVFDRRYRVSKVRKFGILLKFLFAGLMRCE